MSASPGSEEDPSGRPYFRLPLPVVTLLLLAFLGALLAFGLYANGNLRPTAPVAEATATSPPLVLATATPIPVPVAAAPTAIPLVASTATPAIRPLVVTIATATSSAGSGSIATSASTPGTAVISTAQPTVDATLAAEIGTAYVAYWNVRSQALLELDPSHLPEVMSGEYLQTFEQNLDALRSSGRALRTEVTLNYRVIQATPEAAIIVDRIEDDSFYVKPGTDTPLSGPANDVLSLEVKLQRESGGWKVVESVSAD